MVTFNFQRGPNVIEQLRRQSVPASHVVHPAARPSFVSRAISNFKTNTLGLVGAFSRANRALSVPTGNANVVPLVFPGIGPGGAASEAGLLGEARGGSVLSKVGSGLKSFYGKLTANPFAGATSAKDFLKIYGTGAAGILATEEAVRHLYSIGSGQGIGPIIPGKDELAGAAFGGLNRFAALPSFLAGFAKKKGVDVSSYIGSKFSGPMSIPNIPSGPMSIPGQNFNFTPAPVNITFTQPDMALPQAGPIGSFSPSLDVSSGGGGMAEAAILALLLGGGAGFLLGKRRRKKYKRRKHGKKHGRRK